MGSPEMKPSDVGLGGLLPLVGSAFGRAEREMAAALLVRACLANGDAWGPIEKKQIGETIEREVVAEGGCFFHLKENPFAPFPDFRDLAAKGFARFLGSPDDGSPIEFTEAGLDALAKFRKARPEKEADHG